MAYRSGTYVAFDGLGETDPTKSDFKYFAIMKAWDANGSIDFKITDSHEKTEAVRDTSKRRTLEARIQERLRNSKNMVVVLSSDTRKSGSMLSYEIEQAVDNYKLPLIISYVGYLNIRNVDACSKYWLNVLSWRISNGAAKAIHVPFKKEPTLDAISQFSTNNKMPSGSKNYYSDDIYRGWGLL